jgi:hypothetical protein
MTGRDTTDGASIWDSCVALDRQLLDDVVT